MNKLAERLRRAARTEARPVGFTTVATAPPPTMIVVVDLSDGGVDADLEGSGADAVLLSSDASEAAIRAAAADGATVGVRLAGGDRARVAALREAGVDFVVVGGDTAAAALMEEELGYILQIEGEPTDTDLRTLETLPLDAILGPAVDGALTIRRSLDLRRMVAFTRRPLMLPVAGEMSAADLETLRELNVLLLLAPAEAAAALRGRIGELPPRRRRREESTVGVPRVMMGSARSPEPEEMPDEDE